MDEIKSKIQKAITELISNLGVETEIELEIPKNNSFGDFSSNVALKISKQLGKNPLEIAQELSAKLNEINIEGVVKSEAVAPGFINFYLEDSSYLHIVSDIISKGDEYGKSEVGESKKVMIEFGQPNTHKAFHVGHLKSAISGLSMVKLHENLGFEVIKANYFGDVGMHVAKATWGFLKLGRPEGFDAWDKHEKMQYIDKCYVHGSKEFKENTDAEAEIREINKEIYAKSDNEAVAVYKELREVSLEHQKDIWQTLGIVFDREYPESEVYADAIKIVDEFKGSVFEESEGALIYRGEKERLTNWVFLTSEGNPTYSAKDLALASKKFSEYPDLFKAIVTTSIEQKDYFKVVIKVLEKIRPETINRYFHIPFGWMLRADKKKFSSRMGETIKGMDILSEVEQVALSKVSEIKEYSEEEKKDIAHYVAISGLKFLILSHEFHKDFSYDPEKFLSFEGYSGPYILYTYARAKSILRKAESTSQEVNLTHPKEIELLKTLSKYSFIAEESGVKIAPHMICNYVYELSQAFNSFYTECPVINAETEAIRNSRLLLTKASAQVLKNGLNLLGIETVEKM